ncbi:MAG: hypothetical protein ABI183_24695 [Polyangiaceae bacterium]
MHQKRAREFHARAIEAFSHGKTRSARTCLEQSAKEFRAAGDKPNAALVDALLAFAEAEQARATLAIGEAHVAASRAWAAAHRAGHAPLAKQVERFEVLLDAPVATRVQGVLPSGNGGAKLDTAAISELLRSPHHIVVDGHRANVFVAGKPLLDLATRPLIVEMLSSLASGQSISSRSLAADVFSVRTANAKHEARLRSLVTATRKLAKGRLGDFDFVERSFRWTPKKPVIVLVPLSSLLEARVESLLSRGAAYTVRALAKIFDASISSTKQALKALAQRDVVQVLSAVRGGSRASEENAKWATRSAISDLDQVQLF